MATNQDRVMVSSSANAAPPTKAGAPFASRTVFQPALRFTETLTDAPNAPYAPVGG